MAHHGDCMPPEMMRELGLGATGQFPEGKLNDNDEGEIKIGVSHDPATGKVCIAFGKPVAWIGMTQIQALELAMTLHKHARDVRTIRKENETQKEAESHGQ